MVEHSVDRFGEEACVEMPIIPVEDFHHEVERRWNTGLILFSTTSEYGLSAYREGRILVIAQRFSEEGNRQIFLSHEDRREDPDTITHALVEYQQTGEGEGVSYVQARQFNIKKGHYHALNARASIHMVREILGILKEEVIERADEKMEASQ